MIKLAVYLKGGAIIKFKVKEYKFNFNSNSLEFCGYTFKGAKPNVSFVPSQIAAYVEG